MTATAFGSRCVDLDEAHFRGGGLLRDQLQEGLESLLHSPCARRRVLGALHYSQRRLDQRLRSGQEAGLLIGEVTVEGAP